jgi:cytochrome b561
MRRVRFGGSGRSVLKLLGAASWLLLVVSWVMSIYAYPRLPEKMAIWTSFWNREVVRGERAPLFFVYPIAQTLAFLASMVVAKRLFFRAPEPDPETPPSPTELGDRLLDLKREVVYLGLIFLNLVFIHLQTSLILVSHELAKGINRYYFVMLVVVLIGIVPYYRVRRRMLEAG